MASAETEATFNCTPEQFFSIITDYENYPRFLQEVDKCTVVKEEGSRKLVQFDISMIKSFSYKLWLNEDKPNMLSWSFDSGDLFKVSNGSWELSDDGGKTKARYQVEAKFKVFVPGPIAKGLVNVNLPNMIQNYQKRVSEVFGG